MAAGLRRSDIPVEGIAALLALFLPLQVYALDDVSNPGCDAGIVEYGDRAYMLVERCGKPASRKQGGQVWIYDFRPSGFLCYIAFADDSAERIQMGN